MPTPSRDWIRGLADRSCQLLTEARAIVLTSNDGHVLAAAAGYLRTIGIDCRVSWKDGRCALRVGGLEALRRWQDEIGFLDPSKAKQLEEVLRVAD